VPPKKYAIKGEPDFHNISDEKLKAYLDLIQQMIFSYKYHDKDKSEVLTEIWKELSIEDTERLCASAIAEIDRQSKEESSPTSALIKKVPKLRRSPAKSK